MSLPEDDAYDYAEDRRAEELGECPADCTDCVPQDDAYASHGYAEGVTWYGR